MRKFLCILALLLSPATKAAGVSGQLKVTADDYPVHLGPETPDLVPYVTVDLSSKYRLTRKLRFQWHAFALSNVVADGGPENFYGDLPEGFFEYRKSNLKFRLGANTLNWGTVDLMSPSDTVNTGAMFHPLRTVKQGAPMVEMLWGPEALNIDFVYIPWQRRPQIPSKNSRWLPRDVLLNVATEIGRVRLPENPEYNYDPPETLDHALNNNYGAKLASHLGSFDFKLTHFEGAAPSPKIRPHLEFYPDHHDGFTARSPIDLAAVSYRIRTSGFGFAWAHEKWILRGESAYSHTISKDALLQPWSWSNVLAVETNIDIADRTLTLLAQYYYTQNPQAADNLPTSSYRLFDRTAILGGRFAYSENLTVLFSGLYESITRSVFWMIGFDQKLNDHLRFGLSWRDFSGQQDGLIKTFERNDHASVEMTYFF